MTSPEIERAVWRERWRSLRLDIMKGGWVVFLLVAVLALFVAWKSSPMRVVGIERGQVQGVHHSQREDGPPVRRLSVRLDSGGYASVYLPRSVIYRANADVEVRVWERDWFPGRRTYEFVGYVPERFPRPDFATD